MVGLQMAYGIHIPDGFSVKQTHDLVALTNAMKNPNSGDRFRAAGGGKLVEKIGTPDFAKLIQEILGNALEIP